MVQGWGSRRLWALVGLAILLAYAAWIGAPYLRSVVVRDAAVTTWIDVATSPIKGFVGDDPLHAGDSVGQDGVITLIENPLADRTPLVKAEADLDKATERVRGLQELMSSLRRRSLGTRPDGDGACRCSGRRGERGEDSNEHESDL